MRELGTSAEPTETGRSQPRRSLLFVLGATAIAAASSFLVLLVVAPALGPSAYATFAVYWAALFMIVGVLFGVQQETTRAVAQVASSGATVSGPARTSPMWFSLVLGLALLVLLSASGWLWSEPLLGRGNEGWALPLAIAVASYVGVAALNGVLAGRGAWAPFAVLPVIDGLLRLSLVLLSLWQGWGGIALAWAVAIPFPVSLGIVLIWQRRFVTQHAMVTGSYRDLAVNSSRTMLASAATALLVNGFPVVLSLLGGADSARLGAVVLALTLTRAPILVPLTALQSMMIAKLSSSTGSVRRFMAVVLVGIIFFAVLVALVTWVWGEPVLAWIFGSGFAVEGGILAGLVIASGCVGVLTVTGAAALAANKHNAFAAGWVVGALLAVLLVAVLPFEVGIRTVVALIVGPLVGAGWHVLTLRKEKPNFAKS